MDWKNSSPLEIYNSALNDHLHNIFNFICLFVCCFVSNFLTTQCITTSLNFINMTYPKSQLHYILKGQEN